MLKIQSCMKWKPKKTIWVFFIQKYGKFWTFSLDNYIKHKLLIFEEWCTKNVCSSSIYHIYWHIARYNIPIKHKKNQEENLKKKYPLTNMYKGCVPEISVAFKRLIWVVSTVRPMTFETNKNNSRCFLDLRHIKHKWYHHVIENLKTFFSKKGRA